MLVSTDVPSAMSGHSWLHRKDRLAKIDRYVPRPVEWFLVPEALHEGPNAHHHLTQPLQSRGCRLR